MFVLVKHAIEMRRLDANYGPPRTTYDDHLVSIAEEEAFFPARQCSTLDPRFERGSVLGSFLVRFGSVLNW